MHDRIVLVLNSRHMIVRLHHSNIPARSSIWNHTPKYAYTSTHHRSNQTHICSIAYTRRSGDRYPRPFNCMRYECNCTSDYYLTYRSVWYVTRLYLFFLWNIFRFLKSGKIQVDTLDNLILLIILFMWNLKYVFCTMFSIFFYLKSFPSRGS